MAERIQDLEFYGDAECSRRIGDVVDLGEYDVAKGGSFVIYARNPNRHAKGIFESIHVASKNGVPEARTIIDLPSEILPEEVVAVRIKVPATDEDSPDFVFEDIFDQLSGTIKWLRP